MSCRALGEVRQEGDLQSQVAMWRDAGITKLSGEYVVWKVEGFVELDEPFDLADDHIKGPASHINRWTQQGWQAFSNAQLLFED